MERDGVDPIARALVAEDKGRQAGAERSGEAVEINGGIGRGAVGNGVIGQREVVRVSQVDAEGPGVVDAEARDLDRVAAQLDRQDAILPAPGDRRVAVDDEMLRRSGRDAGQIDLDPAPGIAGEGAVRDRERRLGGDAIGGGVANVAPGHGEVLRKPQSRRRADRDSGHGVANLRVRQGIRLARVKDETRPVAGSGHRAYAGDLRHEDRAAARQMRRLLLETAQRRAGGRERAIVHRDRPTEDRSIVIGGEREVAVHRQVSVDEVAEGATGGPDGLPFEGREVGGRPVEGDRIQAVASPGVAADRAAEVGLADAVEVNRGIGGRICRVASAAAGDTVPLEGQVVGRREVHAIRTSAFDGVVLDIDQATAKGRPENRLVRAALDVVAQKFESAAGRGPRGPWVTRVDPMVTGTRATALQVRGIRWDGIDAAELTGADVDRGGVDGDAVREGRPQAAVADDKTVGATVGSAQRGLAAADVDRLGGKQNVGIDDVAGAPDQADADPFVCRQR